LETVSKYSDITFPRGMSKHKQSGLIWYHDKAPRLDIELWAVIDEWTKTGIER